jgi:hypothetical protein
MNPRKPRGTKQNSSKNLIGETKRPVDAAMAGERPPKQTIRSLWLEQHQHYNERFPADDAPLLLTLCGDEGREIGLLVQHGIIKLTETGAIAPEFENRVVAIERNPQAALNLRRHWPGLKIKQINFSAILSGDSYIRFPSGEHERICCAKVINLDLQEPLHERIEEGAIEFPVLRLIHKLSQIHAELTPRIEWCLCLTLNGKLVNRGTDGTLSWSQAIGNVIREFLIENFQRSVEFTTSCRTLLGDDLFGRIYNNTLFDLSVLSEEEQQKLLMIFVPKKIAQLVHPQNWHVRTTWNLRYGGRGSHAPMVTWILSFIWDPRAASTPDAVYRDSLNAILASAGRIDDDGRIEAT